MKREDDRAQMAAQSAVAAAQCAHDDPLLGLREKGVDALRMRWDREGQGDGGRARRAPF